MLFSVHAVLTQFSFSGKNNGPETGSVRIEIPGHPAIGHISNGVVGQGFFITGTFNSGSSIFADQTFLIHSGPGIPFEFLVNGVPLVAQLTDFQVTNPGKP